MTSQNNPILAQLQQQVAQLSSTVLSLAQQLASHRHTGNVYSKVNVSDLFGSIGGSYGGQVDAAATAAVLPTGWTVAVNGSDLYTVTHNLGTTKYSVVLTSYIYWEIPNLVSVNANTFTVNINDATGGAATTGAWTFALVPIV